MNALVLRALALIAGSPDGVTADTLAQHGIPAYLLPVLLRSGDVGRRVERMSNPAGMVRVRFFAVQN